MTTKYEDIVATTAAEGKLWDERTITEVEDKREERDEMVILRIALTAKKVGFPSFHTVQMFNPDITDRVTPLACHASPGT